MAVLPPGPKAPTEPDSEQQQAIGHVHGPLLVLAGAGTGKTTVLTRRIARLIQEGHAGADEILALTYTENAAKEMLQRVKSELGNGRADGLQACTFHGYCHGLLIRSGRNFQVLDDKQLWVFLRRNLRKLGLNYYIRAANISKFLEDLLEFVRRCHDELVGPGQYREYVNRIEAGEFPLPRVAKSKNAAEITKAEVFARCREIASVFETVEGMLRERNLGTFGHMILNANSLLAEDAELLERERAHARFVLVDEFQDANFAQIEVLKKLAGEEQNLFAVGDPDQGIYRFRGASSGAFEVFQKVFPKTKLVLLTRNRRSTTPILKCAHALIAENPQFALRAGGSEYRRSALVSERDRGDKGAPRPPVEAVLVTGSFMEATDLISTLLERRRRARCPWKKVGILYRIHTHRDEVAAELARNGIPFSIEGLDVLDVPEVRDLLACVGAVISDADSASLLRVAALPQFPIDPHDLRRELRNLPRGPAVNIAVVLAKIKGGAELLKSLRQAREEAAGQRAYAVLLTLIRIFDLTRTSAINAMLAFATRWQDLPITENGTAAEFLDYLALFREARGTIPLNTAEEEDAVKLMTVHSAKGLEFDHVFILRAVKGSFPAYYREPLIEIPAELRTSGLADQDEKHIADQEERRLFYVAMTRARDSLTLYGQFGRGEKDKTPPGFLRELIKHRDLKASFRHRTCREFQTDMFGVAESSASSRLSEWIALPPSSDLAANLSASSIQHYETCPLQFKLEREWRIPGEPSAALQYGASMHRVLLAYYDSVRWERELDEGALIDLLKSDLAEQGFADQYQHELYEQKGILELQEFIAVARGRKPEVLHTEERFSVQVGPTNLVGRIDRIDRGPNGKVVITDYKTGRPRSQEDADESLQLTVYALAARETWGYDAERLAFHNLESNTVIATSRNDAQLEGAKLKIGEIASNIAAGKFEPKPGFHCGFCAYRVLCPKTEKRVPEIRAAAVEQSS
jgi:DNA helicase-2/ATP-dependent DNA helicase PcrA